MQDEFLASHSIYVLSAAISGWELGGESRQLSYCRGALSYVPTYLLPTHPPSMTRVEYAQQLSYCRQLAVELPLPVELPATWLSYQVDGHKMLLS